MPANGRACSTCTFWDGTYCRRYAPALFSASAHAGAMFWPITKAADWCGEYIATITTPSAFTPGFNEGYK